MGHIRYENNWSIRRGEGLGCAILSLRLYMDGLVFEILDQTLYITFPGN
ncbi:MAG: hypothetical protein H8E12_17025 [Rhodobacteraceae bacterium]|nr:hypothetical protein [Paracoccaceae bacterium]